MSFLYPMEVRISTNACYNSFDESEGSESALSRSLSHTLPYLLWGDDPYLGAKLLSSIAGEAVNRKLSTLFVYNPLLPEQLSALEIQDVGTFTQNAHTFSSMPKLIDCTQLSAGQTADSAQIKTLNQAKHSLVSEITAISRSLSDQILLRKTAAARVIDTASLSRRASGIARRMPRGDGHQIRLPILSYGDTKGICYLPFEKEVRIIGLTAQYDLASLFLDALTDALDGRHCNRVILTNALTHEMVGIWIPDSKICYLTEAPAEIREKQLTLSRYLIPHTAQERRVCRHLFAAQDLWEAHLVKKLAEYRVLAAEEAALYSSLYTASRLQNFRKRLLIDLFCKPV